MCRFLFVNLKTHPVGKGSHNGTISKLIPTLLQTTSDEGNVGTPKFLLDFKEKEFITTKELGKSLIFCFY